jgi:hypothetical protein
MLQETIPTSLLKLSTDNAARAVKMFASIQKYMGECGEALPQATRLEIVQKLLHQVCFLLLQVLCAFCHLGYANWVSTCKSRVVC